MRPPELCCRVIFSAANRCSRAECDSNCGRRSGASAHPSQEIIMARRPPIGITFDPGPDALAGTTPNPNALAVGGVNTGNQSSGFIAGPEPFGKSPVGLFGRSNNTGVFGFSDKAGGGVGVAGNTIAGTGTGVYGHEHWGWG